MSKPLDPIKPVNIHNIRIDGGTQSRAAINQEVVTEYAAALADGDYLPEIIVFFDGVDYWLGDGFHRLHAHLSLQKASIVAEIRKGTQRDAILFSLKANVVHGLRPNNEDKRKAVLTMLDDPEWSEMKDRAIARHCGCSHMTVARIRASLAEPETPEIGTSAKNAPAEIGTSASPQAAAPVPAVVTSAKKQAEDAAAEQARQVAEDAHGESDPIAMLEEATQQIATLQQELFAAQADDQKAETLKWRRIADVAQRRQDELMDTVNAREKELQRQANWLRRIAVAVGEDDNSKLAAKVEALARTAKA